MTPTSDERREVAARLREDASCSESTPREVFESYLDIEYDGEDVFEESYKSESLLHLADLIDPTCHLGPAHFGGFGCDRCFTWFPDMKKRTRHCPECGARVVDDE